MAVRAKKQRKPRSLHNAAALLRRTADELEAHQPLVDEAKVADALLQLDDLLHELGSIMRAAQRIPMKQYLQARAAWLEAWSRDAAHLRRASRSVLKHASHKNAKLPDEDCQLEPLRLLVEVIAACGVRKALELTDWLAPEPEEKTDYGLAIDHDANRSLQIWGRMSGAEFIAGWDQLNVAMIKRCARALGLPVLKRWPKSAREEMHRRAVRFVRNTQV